MNRGRFAYKVESAKGRVNFREKFGGEEKIGKFCLVQISTAFMSPVVAAG